MYKRTIFTLLFALFFTINAHAGFEVRTDSSGSIGLFNVVNCDASLTCTKNNGGVIDIATSGTFSGAISATTGTFTGDVTGDGGDQLYGFLNNQVAATATTITASQCGSSFINSGAVQMELPEASTVLGCRLTFITGNASNFDVNPDDADQILVETNAAGDAIRNATLGNSITIEAISASEWVVISVIGTYADID